MSFAGWACRPEDADNVEDWVRARGDMRNVRLVSLDGYNPTGCAHLHIYVVTATHEAAQ